MSNIQNYRICLTLKWILIIWQHLNVFAGWETWIEDLKNTRSNYSKEWHSIEVYMGLTCKTEMHERFWWILSYWMLHATEDWEKPTFTMIKEDTCIAAVSTKLCDKVTIYGMPRLWINTIVLDFALDFTAFWGIYIRIYNIWRDLHWNIQCLDTT